MKRLLGLATGVLSDRTALWSAMVKLWPMLGGVLTLPLVAAGLSEEEQGVYYSFVYLAQASVFLELGFCQTFVQYSAREFSGLRFSGDGRLEGEAARLVRMSGLTKFAVKWFATGAGVFALALLIGGWVFFSRTVPGGIAWKAPWCCFVVFSALNLLWLPLWALMEGCQRVLEITRLRLKASVLALSALWLVLWAGGGLWAQAAFQGGIFLVAGIYWLHIRRPFVLALLSLRDGQSSGWFREMLPFQWRIAVSFVCGFLLFSLLVPLAQTILGPAAAGRLGMTLQASNAIMAMAAAWVQTKAPALGLLAAKNEIVELRRILAVALRSAFAVAAAGSGAFLIGLAVLQRTTPFGHRFLAVPEAALLLVAGMANVLIGGLAVGLRARIREPFMPLSVGLAVVVLVATSFGGRMAGLGGFILGYSAAMSLVGLPFAILIYRREIKKI